MSGVTGLQEAEKDMVARLRKQATVKAKEWTKPHTPHVTRAVKPPTCPLTPVLMTNMRASKKDSCPDGTAVYTTHVSQVL